MKNMDSDIVNRPIKKDIYIYIYIYIYKNGLIFVKECRVEWQPR